MQTGICKKKSTFLGRDVRHNNCFTEEEKKELRNFVVVCDEDAKIVALLHKALCRPDFLPNINLESNPEECVLYHTQQPFSKKTWADIRKKIYLGVPYTQAKLFFLNDLELLTEVSNKNLTKNLDLKQIEALLGTAKLMSKTLGDPKESKNILRKAQALSLLYFFEGIEHTADDFKSLAFIQAVSHFKHIGGNEALRLRLESLVRDQNYIVRSSAAQVLGAIGDGEALRVLRDSSDSESVERVSLYLGNFEALRIFQSAIRSAPGPNHLTLLTESFFKIA